MKSKINFDTYVRIYDNGGKTFDRYTSVYLQEPENRPNTFNARGMSERPFHPQGFGCSCSATPGRHLGKRIKLKDLPKDCQKLVLSDLKEYFRWLEGSVVRCDLVAPKINQINEMLKGLSK